MSEPRRLALDPSTDLERALLGSARARAPLDARRRAVLAAGAVVAASGLTASTASAGGALAKVGSALAAHWIAVSAVVGIGAVAGAVAFDHRHAVDVPRVVETSVVAPAVPVPSPTPTTSVAQTAVPQTVAPTSAPEASIVSSEPHASTLPSATPSVTAEVAYLEQARAALSAGNPAQCLSILDQYPTRFPHASMTPEATVLRIESLIAAGDRDAAKRAGDAFLASHPASPYATRIHSLVGPNP